MKLFVKISAALVALYGSGIAFAGREGWTSDFSAAKKEAAETKKNLLIDFTGSDWCGWCIKLDKEVFSQDAFKMGVKDKLVLVEIDFPKDKSKLTEATAQQNTELGKKFAIHGYPTILLCDAEGKPFASTGYKPGGPETYVKQLDELLAGKVTRDNSFDSAAKATGVEKAKALIAALTAMGLDEGLISTFYGDVVEQIKAADPQDETGFGKAAAAKNRINAFQNELGTFAQNKDFDSALALVDKTLKEGGWGAEETQQMMMTRAMIFAQQKKFDEAIQAVDEAKAFAPDSKMAPGIEGFRARLEAAKKNPNGGK